MLTCISIFHTQCKKTSLSKGHIILRHLIDNSILEQNACLKLLTIASNVKIVALSLQYNKNLITKPVQCSCGKTLINVHTEKHQVKLCQQK